MQVGFAGSEAFRGLRERGIGLPSQDDKGAVELGGVGLKHRGNPLVARAKTSRFRSQQNGSRLIKHTLPRW